MKKKNSAENFIITGILLIVILTFPCLGKEKTLSFKKKTIPPSGVLPCSPIYNNCSIKSSSTQACSARKNTCGSARKSTCGSAPGRARLCIPAGQKCPSRCSAIKYSTRRNRLARKRKIRRTKRVLVADNNTFANNLPPLPSQQTESSCSNTNLDAKLKKIHALQLELVINRKTLSTSDKRTLFTDLISLGKNFNDIKNFPYGNKFQRINILISQLSKDKEKPQFHKKDRVAILEIIQKEQRDFLQQNLKTFAVK